MKIKWPWDKNRALIEDTRKELSIIKKALVKARLVNFILVVDHKKDTDVVYEQPRAIDLEDLLCRVVALEEKRKLISDFNKKIDITLQNIDMATMGDGHILRCIAKRGDTVSVLKIPIAFRYEEEYKTYATLQELINS